MRRLVLLFVLLLSVPASAAPGAGFRWPLAGTPTVDRAFEPPTTTYGPGHRGVDLRALPGQAVLAAGAGRVSYAGQLAGRGVVAVQHDGGLRTTYEPVRPAVHVGQLVLAGAVLGHVTSGHASCVDGTTCLHWGLLRGQVYLDPLGLVVARDVRLLPVPPVAAAPAAGPGRPPRLEVAKPGSSRAWSGPARSVGAVVAAGALLTGIGLLVRNPRSTGGPTGPSAPGSAAQPVDLLERRRRRAA